MGTIAIPWGAWYETKPRSLSFPDRFELFVPPVSVGPDLGAEEIRIALESPVGSPTLAELAARTQSGVAVAVANLSRTARRVGIARETTELFRSAVDDQTQKLRLGLGTVIDLILTEDRLIQAELGEVAARREYASAVVRLRFETASLLQPSGAVQQIDHATITSPPPPGAVP